MAEEKLDQTIATLQSLMDGTYGLPASPSLEIEAVPLFVGLSRVTLPAHSSAFGEGVLVRTAYARVFAPPMVAVSRPPQPSAVSPAPWYALESSGHAEYVYVELALAAAAMPFGMPRVRSLRLIASTLRLLSAQPAYMPLLSTVSFEEAKAEGATAARMIRVESEPAFMGRSVILDARYIDQLITLSTQAVAAGNDLDLSAGLVLADAFWWLPNASAQLIAIWTAIEFLMKPGRQDIARELARAVRAYVAFDQAHGDRIYQDVVRLYASRGRASHAGAEPSLGEVQESYALLRSILLRALIEGRRPAPRERIVPLWKLRQAGATSDDV